MKRRISLILSAVLLLALVPLTMPSVVPTTMGASHVLPSGGDRVDGVRAIWDVGGASGLTAEMLQTINRIEVTSGSNQGRGLSIYCNGANNDYWDPVEVTEIGQYSGGKYVFQLAWKRDVFGPGPAQNINIGCAWWTSSWSSVGATRVEIFYGESLAGQPMAYTAPHLIGKVNSSKFSETTKGRIKSNGNSGNINAADATLLRAYLNTPSANRAAFASANSFNTDNADINGDGAINEADLAKLREYLAATDPLSVDTGSTGGSRRSLPGTIGSSGTIPPADREALRNYRMVALTYDDGPIIYSSSGATAAIVEALSKCETVMNGTTVTPRVTFFSQGRRFATRNPSTGALTPIDQIAPFVKRAHDLGHDWENHSWEHFTCPNYDRADQSAPCGHSTCPSAIGQFSTQQIQTQIIDTNDAIEMITGRRPKYLRFPRFESNTAADSTIAAQGMKTIHAGFDTNDWRGPSTAANFTQSGQKIANYFLLGGASDGQTRSAYNAPHNVNNPQWSWDGNIVLMHDAGGDGSINAVSLGNAHAISLFVPAMMEAGYLFVTVEELSLYRNWTPANGSGGGNFNGHAGYHYNG